MIGVGQQTYVPDNNFEAYLENNFLKKFEIRTERPTKKKPTHLSGFLFNKMGQQDYNLHLFD